MRLSGGRILKKVLGIFIFSAFLFAILVFVSYRDLKQIFIERISEKATVLFGQRVDIGEISLSPSGTVTIHHLAVHNPEEVSAGHLLRVKGITLSPIWLHILQGQVSLKRIEILAPEITLLSDEKGIRNLSDRLRSLLTEKGTLDYRIDELRIDAGSFSLNSRSLLTVDRVDLSLQNLSTRREDKILISGSIAYAENPVKIKGWAFLNDPAGKFSMTFHAAPVNFSSLRDAIAQYGIDFDKREGALTITAEGDMVQGAKISTTLEIHEKTILFRKKEKTILLKCEAFYNPAEDSLVVDNLSLHTDHGPAFRIKGFLSNLRKDLSYTAEVEINRIDLAHFPFLLGAEIRGEITSGMLRITGDAKKKLPGITGTLKLSRGVVKTSIWHIEETEADLSFSPDRGLSVGAQISARLLRLGEYRTDKPHHASLTLQIRGQPEEITVISALDLPAFAIESGDGKTFFFKELKYSGEGTLVRGTIFVVKNHITAKSIVYDSYSFPALRSSFNLDHRGNTLNATDIRISTGDTTASAARASVTWDEKRTAYSVIIRALNVIRPENNWQMTRADIDARLRRTKENLSGEITVSAGEIDFQGMKASVQEGGLQFNEEAFSLIIPPARIAKGSVELRAQGKTRGGPFPITITMTADNLDLGGIAGSQFLKKMPYGAAGVLQKVSLNGMMDSTGSLQGEMALKAEKISLLRKEGKGTVLKDAGLTAEAVCEGKDCVFTADIAAGSVRAAVSGKATGIVEKNRTITLKALLPETKLTELRNAFWDSFPDSLLYAGLDGSLSVDASLQYSESAVLASGTLRVASVFLNGENGEYAVGPVSGTLPFHYDTIKQDRSNGLNLPSYEPSDFRTLAKSHAKPAGDGFHRISFGTVRYGFRLLDSLEAWIKPDGNLLNIGLFNANIFGGRLTGSAMVDFTEGIRYRGGFLLEGISLTSLCEEIEPIRGYISGKVDGIGTIKGSDAGISQLIGKADFWTYNSDNEKTKISREFLQKVGGPSLKSYLGDRSFDKGVLALYLQNGFIIFRELEISNRNILGMTDLSVKVAPYNNRVDIHHLLWTITVAAQRAGDSE